jgi:HlyD family secretion protein
MAVEHSGTWLRHLGTYGKVVLVLVAVATVIWWFNFAPVSVEHHSVSSGEVVAEVMGTGTVDAHLKATISTKISGRLLNVLVDEGDSVRQDQEVARLDEHDLTLEVEIEEANVTARMAGVERLQADIVHAKATFDFATKSEARIRKLTESASQDELDKSIEALALARAALSRTEAAHAEGRKQLAAAQKALEFRKARLADTLIKAPFAGLIVRRDRDPGDVVVPGSSILALVSTDEIWVRAWVGETSMAELKPGQPARIIFRSEPNRTYPGKVVRLGRETDRETREFLIDVRSDQLPEHWTIGQRAEVYVETSRRTNVTILPASWIVWRDGTPGVFVAADTRATWRELTLGLRGRDSVEIINGVSPGEVVIRSSDPKSTLTEGRRVAFP